MGQIYSYYVQYWTVETRYLSTHADDARSQSERTRQAKNSSSRGALIQVSLSTHSSRRPDRARPGQTDDHRHQHRPRVIRFYNKEDPHYGFTNFSPHKVEFEGKIYPTSEHLFQAFKFLGHHPSIAEHIRTVKTPRMAFSEARRFEAQIRKDWSQKHIEMMEIAIRHKFEQYSDLRRELLSTGDATLVEDAGANDAFWGNGPDGKGRNELGKALMRLRTELQRRRA